MAKYLDLSKFQYKDIPVDERPKSGDHFICRTPDFENPFEDWDYIVGHNEEEKLIAKGKFKNIVMAKLFANAC